MVKRLSITIVSTVVIIAAALIGNVVAGNKPSLGLDLQGGASITLQPVGDYTAASLEKAVEIIERRDRKSTRLNSSYSQQSRMPSSA